MVIDEEDEPLTSLINKNKEKNRPNNNSLVMEEEEDTIPLFNRRKDPNRVRNGKLINETAPPKIDEKNFLFDPANGKIIDSNLLDF